MLISNENLILVLLAALLAVAILIIMTLLSRVREVKTIVDNLREDKRALEERVRAAELELAVSRDELKVAVERRAAEEATARMLEIKAAERESGLIREREERDRIAGELQSSMVRESELRERLAQQEFRIREQQDLLRNATERLKDTFGALSHDALEKNIERFKTFIEAYLSDVEGRQRLQREDAERLFDGIGRQIREKLVQVEETIRGFDKRRGEVDAQLREQILGVNEAGKRVGDEAKRLTEALTKSSVQGSWGEMKLRSVVEAAGMDEFCDFSEQVATVGDHGRLRPDMIIRMPGGLQVVVDAKSPLTNYLHAAGTHGEVRGQYIGELVKAIKSHIRDIANRNYPNSIDNCFEYTILFLPIEGMFFLAIEHDERLLDYATEYKVLLTTPLSLIALLRSIAAGWTQLRVQENVEEIRNLGRELYSRLGILFKYAGDMGKAIEKSVENYNRMVVSWNSRLVPSARRFDELGAGTDKKVEVLDQIGILPSTNSPEEINVDVVVD